MDISGPTPQPDQQGSTPGSAAPGTGSSTPGPDVARDALDAQPAADAASTEVGDASLTDGPSHLVRYLAVYTVLRLALVAALTVVLSFFMPLIVALLFAIIVQLPLAWLLFAGPRGRVNDAMATASARRRAERARLQSALTGDVDAG